MAVGLFIGLTTLDFIYLTSSIPQPNQKIVAIDALTAAGGPATNAAMTFQGLGNHVGNYVGNYSRLLSAIGQHPSTQMIRHDLTGLDRWDLAPESVESPPISSILVTQATGDRAVISINAKRFPVDRLPDGMSAEALLCGVDVVLIDGHQMSVSRTIAALAKAQGIPVVLDGGSWKPGFEAVLPFVDYAICSANFIPPSEIDLREGGLFGFLGDFGIPFMAITQGSKEILYCDRGQLGTVVVSVVPVIDTLGAGDIFHGAFCHFILQPLIANSIANPIPDPFPNALSQAATIAGRSCQYFGTRSWLAQVKSKV
jgi:sugar/nucleoside kinase (ribokinase family)